MLSRPPERTAQPPGASVCTWKLCYGGALGYGRSGGRRSQAELLRTAPEGLSYELGAGEYRAATRGCGAPKARVAACRSAPSPPGNDRGQACTGVRGLRLTSSIRPSGSLISTRRISSRRAVGAGAMRRRLTERRRSRGHPPWMSSAMNALTCRLGGCGSLVEAQIGAGPDGGFTTCSRPSAHASSTVHTPMSAHTPAT